MRRKAKNIQSTYWMSFHHLAQSLIEESHARFAVYKRQGRPASYQEIVTEVLEQQLMAYAFIDKIARKTVEKDFAKLSYQEIERNQEILDAISKELEKSADNIGVEWKTDAAQMHAEITKIWNMLTTNQTLITPDINYRTYSMRVPGASRSLFPYPHLPMYGHSSPVANYITYAEVPQASRITKEDTLSFGFLNAVYFDPETGEGSIIEHPHYMYSTDMMKLAAEVPNAFEAVFGSAMQSRQNHDLLHHLVQVYGDHFQIHHPSAPISQKGYSQDYLAFARDMRAYRDSYELAAVSGQATIYAHRGQGGEVPLFVHKEIELMRKTHEGILSVQKYLLECGRAEEAQRFVDYSTRAMLGMYAFIFAPETAERNELDEKIEDLSPSPVDVSFHQIIAMLDAQGFLSVSEEEKHETIKRVISDNPAIKRLPNMVRYQLASAEKPTKKYASYINAAFYSCLSYCKDSVLQKFYDSKDLSRQYPKAEFGSDILLSMLKELNLLQNPSAFPIRLKGAVSVHWVLLGGNNKPGLKGLAEKGHAIDTVPYGREGQASVFDMIVGQEDALSKQSDVYTRRVLANQYAQRAAHYILQLFSFTHASEENTLPSFFSALYRNDIEHDMLKEAIGVFDQLVEDIFTDQAKPLGQEQKGAFSAFKDIISRHKPAQAERYFFQIYNASKSYQRYASYINQGHKNSLEFSVTDYNCH
jgi:hypothetical protein